MLRGINLGPNRRVPMAELRALLTDAGYEDVRTYVQSGNIVLRSSQPVARLERDVAGLLHDRFGFEVPVVGRTAAQLAKVVARNPLGDVADDPKRYQVSFLSAPLAPNVDPGCVGAEADEPLSQALILPILFSFTLPSLFQSSR